MLKNIFFQFNIRKIGEIILCKNNKNPFEGTSSLKLGWDTFLLYTIKYIVKLPKIY